MLNVALLFIAGYSVSALLLGVNTVLPVFITHTMVIPMVFRFCKPFQRKLIFLNFINWPPGLDLEDPLKIGIEGTRNFYLEHESKVDNATIEIGVWHVLPSSVLERLRTKLDETTYEKDRNLMYDEEIQTSGKPIIMYCHGNANSRGAAHRIKLYQVLQQMDFHVIAFDYRGYGDSSSVVPSECGAVEDALVVYNWILTATRHAPCPPPVFIWGHSLGTGISSHLLGNLDRLSVKLLERADSLPLPSGLILEAPFNNLQDEVANHPLTKLVRWLPYFEATFVRPFSGYKDYEFKSDVHLARALSLPVLILHAKDDRIVPYHLGVKLYEAICRSRSGGRGARAALLSYEESQKLGHKWICNAPDLPQIIRDFVNDNDPDTTSGTVNETQL